MKDDLEKKVRSYQTLTHAAFPIGTMLSVLGGMI